MPGAECTRQRLLCTRQSLCRVQHSAKSLRQKVSRQRFLCRVLFIGHPAKTLPSANPAPGKEKWSLRRRLRHPLLCRVPCQRHPAKIFLIFFQIFFAGCRAGEAPGKDFFIFFYNFFAGCRTARAPGKEFFIFFRNFFAGCQVMGHPAKNFFFLKKLCRVPWPWHSAKLGIPSERNSQLC